MLIGKNSQLEFFSSLPYAAGFETTAGRVPMPLAGVPKLEFWGCLSFSADPNLLHGYPSPYPRHLFSDWQINIGYNFIGSQVADTSFKDQSRTIIDTSFRTVTLNDIYIEPKFTLSRHGNFAFSLAIPVHMISLMGSANIKNDQFQYWAAPTLELMYYSQKDSGSKLFFRYRYYSNLSDNTQAFTQIQLGYSLNLSSLWGPGN